MKLHRIYIFVLPLLLISCVSQKRVEYLQDKQQKTEFNIKGYSDYKIKPYDELYIEVSSLDEATSFVKSKSTESTVGTMTAYSAALVSYAVDKDGYINFSLVGKIFVKGMTIDQVSDEIKKSLSGMLNLPIIKVKLLSRRFTILGYVKTPGSYNYNQDKFTIFDALGTAGDVIDYSNKRTVVLVRETEGKIVRKELNLENAQFLTSEDYYIQPNDLIYVKPLRRKFWGMAEIPLPTVLTTVLSTAASAILLKYVIK